MTSFPMRVCASNSHSSFCLPNFLLILQLPVQTSSPPESLPQTFPSLLSSVLPKSLKLTPYFFIFHLNYTSHYRKYAKASGHSLVFSTALRSRNKTQSGYQKPHSAFFATILENCLRVSIKAKPNTFPKWLHVQALSSHPDNGACLVCLAL